jgi:hypothetical protein
MNFDDLQKTWVQQTVAGAAMEPDRLRAGLESEVRQRSRNTLRVIGVAAFVFVVAWVVSLTAHFTGILRFTTVSLTTLLVVTGFAALFFAVAWRAYQRTKREASSMGATLVDSLTSSLRAVAWQMRDCILFGYALGLAVLGQILVSAIRHGFGDVRSGVALANVAFTVVIAGAAALTVRRYYRQQLLPRRDELTRELAHLGVSGDPAGKDRGPG